MHNRQQLQQIKKYYQQKLITHLSTGIVVLDSNLTIAYVNPAAESMFVRSFNRIYGHKFNDIFYQTTIDNERLALVLKSGQEFTDSEVVIKFLENHQITLEVTATPAELDKASYLILECKQIDHQKEISLETFQHQQWEAARDLIKGLAHEIKNPLGGLRGAAQLLEKELSVEQKEYTHVIIEQADRLTKLVDRLLGPNQLPSKLALNIHKVMEKVVQLIVFENPLHIKLIRDYDPSIPEVYIDEDKIQQAVLNILRNAVQALQDSGEIILKTRIASNQTINGVRIRLLAKISIIDNGPGIPENIQDTLFYPMVTSRTNGTGLGLSISQTLINQHGGKVSFNSRPGRTEFTILIPLEDEHYHD